MVGFGFPPGTTQRQIDLYMTCTSLNDGADLNIMPPVVFVQMDHAANLAPGAVPPFKSCFDHMPGCVLFRASATRTQRRRLLSIYALLGARPRFNLPQVPGSHVPTWRRLVASKRIQLGPRFDLRWPFAIDEIRRLIRPNIALSTLRVPLHKQTRAVQRSRR